MQKFKTQSLASSAIAAGISIVCGASAWAGEASDVFVPIKDSTSNDPAGMQLMIISIGILVTMVMAIFIVTTIYMMQGNKKTKARAAAARARAASAPAVSEPDADETATAGEDNQN